jgi:hypothetical protein
MMFAPLRRVITMFGIGKNNAAIDAFAAEIVADVGRRFPVRLEAELGGTKAKPARKLGKTAGDLQRRVAAFQVEAKLGVYGKARLLNQIKWGLKETGYSEPFIDATITTLASVAAK